MLVSRNWLQKYFDTPLPFGNELAEYFNAHAFEVEGVEEKGDDTIIDLDILPNRTSDALCQRGIARDLATILSLKMKSDPLRETLPAWDKPEKFTVTIENEELCPRYMAGVVRGVEVGPSPKWLTNALESIGQKSINNIVDATNYVMFNLGQPIHAFDLSLLEQDSDGNRNITIRLAREGEQITTLTDYDYTLKATHQLIVDGISDEPLALAGIKGGKRAEVTDKTVDIVIEVANFHPTNVRRTSKDIKLQTDASLRFQHEPDVLLPAFAMRDVIALIEEVAKGKLLGVVDDFTPPVENDPIDVTLPEINSTLGLKLSKEEVEHILLRFEWEFSYDKNKDEFAVTGPWERTDIHIKEDVIEEIGRMYGYSNIESNLPKMSEESTRINKNQYVTEIIQDFLVGKGYSEILSYAIQETGEVELANHFASDKAFMRMNLTQGMMQALDKNAHNAPLLGLTDVKLFEVGTVFTKKDEKLHLCVGMRPLSRKQSKADTELEKDLKDLFSELGAEFKIKIIDGVAEFELDTFIERLDAPEEYKVHHKWDTDARFEQWSAYPFVLRDIAVWVPKGVSNEEIFSIIKSEATDLLVRYDLFDEFEKDDRVSYAWHMVFQSKERTLTDEEVGTIMENITTKLNSTEGWEVR